MERGRYEADPQMNLDVPANIGKRIGLLGGTFDPVHHGHLAAASAAKREFSLGSVVFIPSAHPPHKPDQRISSFADRLAMLRCALLNHEGYYISEVEQERGGESYTIETLILFRKRYGSEVELFFIIGIDAFAEISTWKQYARLPLYAHFIVIDRPSLQQEGIVEAVKKYFKGWRYDREGRYWFLEGVPGRIFPLRMEAVDVSSTEIRRLVASDEKIASMVPSCVEEYIAKRHLYQIP